MKMYDYMKSSTDYSGTVGYISGYSNPKLRINASCNVKPVKVMLQTAKQLLGTDIGFHPVYYCVILDKNDNPTKKFVKSYEDSLSLFDTHIESVVYYNKCVDDVINKHNVIIDKLNSLKIKDN